MIEIILLCILKFCCADYYEKLNLKYEQLNDPWMVIAIASVNYRNYRHFVDGIELYRYARKSGFPDNRILLLLGDDVACNSRNLFPGQLFSDINKSDIYSSEEIDVDFQGPAFNKELFIRLLIGHMPDDTPYNKKLNSNKNSNVFIYLTGHGNNQFMRFRRSESLEGSDFANIIEHMYVKGRYGKLVFIYDSCGARGLIENIYSPNVLVISTSNSDEDSLSMNNNQVLGTPLIDKFIYYLIIFLNKVTFSSQTTFQDLIDFMTFDRLKSTISTVSTMYNKSLSDIKIADFFTYVRPIEVYRKNVIENDFILVD